MDETNEEMEMYDEFGNYIGPDLDSSDEESSDEENEETENVGNRNIGNEDEDSFSEMQIEVASDNAGTTADPSSMIVLHEDKVHYPSASTVYGPNVTTAILDEDTMHISEPIMPPEPTPVGLVGTGSSGGALDQENQRVSDAYLAALSSNHLTKRGIALIGNLHSGKTSIIDILLATTLYDPSPSKLPPKYTDITKIEREKHMSLTSTPITLPLTSCHKQKTYSITMMDNPGHIQFHDESVATLKIADGAVLVMDVVEGLTLHDEMLIRQCVSEGLPMVLVLNKMDRLMTDLKLPVEDAYYKLRVVLEEVNLFVKRVGNGKFPTFCPTRNVIFSSALHGWIVTLSGMAEMYVDHMQDVDEEDDDEYVEDGKKNVGRFGHGALGKNLTTEEFVKRLWGNCYLDPLSKRFHKKASDCTPGNTQRTFCQFVLEPIYKVYSACLGEAEKDVSKVLRSVGVHLSRDQLRSSSSDLLKTALQKFFDGSSGFVDLIVKNV
jgi:U5 small nuclear ribonucleoprotein component